VGGTSDPRKRLDSSEGSVVLGEKEWNRVPLGASDFSLLQPAANQQFRWKEVCLT